MSERLRAAEEKVQKLTDAYLRCSKSRDEAHAEVDRLRSMLAIAVEEWETHDGRSNEPAHWTNEARKVLGQ